MSDKKINCTLFINQIGLCEDKDIFAFYSDDGYVGIHVQDEVSISLTIKSAMRLRVMLDESINEAMQDLKVCKE